MEVSLEKDLINGWQMSYNMNRKERDKKGETIWQTPKEG